MPEPRKVVHVVSRMTRGGIETWLLRVLRKLDRERFQVTIVTLSGAGGELDDEVRALGVPIKVVSAEHGSWPRFARDLIDFLGQCRPHAVHSHMFFRSGTVLRAAQKVGVPIRIAHSHNTSDHAAYPFLRRFYRVYMRRLLRAHSTATIGCSTEAGQFLFGRGWRNRPNTHVLPCGVDVDAFGTPADRETYCRELGIPADHKIVGHVGSFTYQKNHAFLVDIAAALAKRDAKTHVLLVGGGDLRPKIEEKVRALGIEDRVTFAGLRGDVPVLMETVFDLFILPSHYEGLPVVALEAQCANVPSLMSDVISRETTVIDPLVHWQSLSRSADDWAARALGIMAQPRPDPADSRQKIRDSIYSIDASVRLLSDLYEESLTIS